MSHKLWKSFIILIISGVVYAQPFTVAVFDLELIGDISPTEGKAFSEVLRTQLASLGEYEVVERAQLQKVLEEQQFALGDLVDENSAAEFGKMVGAYYVVTGSIVKDKNRHIINLRFINVSKGTVELAHSIKVKRGEDLTQACERLVKEISNNVKKGRLESKEKTSVSQSKSSKAINIAVGVSGAVIVVAAILILVF